MKSPYLFVYGTLKKGFDNPTARYLHSTQEFIGEASFPGILFKVSFYPGAVYLPDSEKLVHGHLFKVENNRDILFKKLDTYEGVGQEYEESAEFRKEIIPVQTPSGIVEAVTYLYNASYRHFPLILSGRFKR